METSTSTPRDQLEHEGYILLRGIFTSAEMQLIAQQLSDAFDRQQRASVLRSRGRVYGSRNLLEAVPEVAALLDRRVLRSLVSDVLGAEAGLVRVLFFDKPPDRSWSLPWHKDRTIAVRRNDLASEHFENPTTKAGVPHVEAPDAILERMLTLRVHLDPMTESNGPLCVIPGSHRSNDQQPHAHVQVHAAIGDVLAMRPLLTHCSTVPLPGNELHRRVIHFEIADTGSLPDGYEWHTFQTL